MRKTIAVFIILMAFSLSSSFAFAASAVQGGNTETSVVPVSLEVSAAHKLVQSKAIPFNKDRFAFKYAVTRSEFVAILDKALDIEINFFKAPDIKDYFTDVEQDAPFTSSLIDLATANIIEDGGSFRPGDKLTREEMVHYIMNAYRYKMGDNYKQIKIAPPSFKDSDKITPEYSGDVARAVYYKLIPLSDESLFNPKGSADQLLVYEVINNLVSLLEIENEEVVVQPRVEFKENSLEMNLSITNHSKEPVSITHSSGQKYDFTLLDSDRNGLYTWSADKAFIMLVSTSKIEPGESVEYHETLSGDEYEKIRGKIAYLKAYVVGSSEAFTINPHGYEISIDK